MSHQRQLSLIDHWQQLTTELEIENRALCAGTGRTEAIQPLVSRLTELVQRDGDVAIYLCIRQDLKRTLAYAATHPVHCAVVCALAGNGLGWTTAR